MKKKRLRHTAVDLSPQAGHGYGSQYGMRKSKTDWAGINIGDAFKSNLDYYVRLPAQRLFYRKVKASQKNVLVATCLAVPSDHEFRIKPQIAPCFTNYPATLGAYSAIGLTTFLEYQEQVKEKILLTYLKEYLQNPADQDEVFVCEESYKKMAHIVAKSVQDRLTLEDLSRQPALAAIEIYRLFSASHQDLKFRSVPEIVRSVILYGDVLPDWKHMRLNSMTRALLREISDASLPYLKRLPETRPEDLVKVGMEWVRTLCKALAHFLPEPEEDKDEASPLGDFDPETEGGFRFSRKNELMHIADRIPPLEEPQPPSLFDPLTLAEQLAQRIINPAGSGKKDGENPPESALDKRIKQTISEIQETLKLAGGQDRTWEDMRSDRVELNLKDNPFCPGPMEGNPADGHQVDVEFGNSETAAGNIFDRPVELSEDLPACEMLEDDAALLSQTMKRTLYPNREMIPHVEKRCTSGSLDPARLVVAETSNAVFKRYRLREKADRRGRPVLVIACDGSGSLNHLQMRMLKVLCAAWLRSTANSTIQVMAGLYHSGSIRPGVSGPLVQWLYHPHKTPSTGRADAVRALVSLPVSGTGVQSDALSIAFIMQEAQSLARNKMIYLILITDCAWNSSFHSGKTGKQEVHSLFESLYDQSGDKLHCTLVALGVENETGFEQLLDKVICIKADELTDYIGVASKIGLYVASCVRERMKTISKG